MKLVQLVMLSEETDPISSEYDAKLVLNDEELERNDDLRITVKTLTVMKMKIVIMLIRFLRWLGQRWWYG